jgi:CRISPR system Cascade subunit CasA
VLTDAEAARWLLHVIGFDDTAAKPTRGKNLPSPGAGWLGKTGLLIACGQNIFETMMLNFVMVQKPDGTSWKYEEQVATWEPEKARREERTEIPQPQDPAALFTIQSRRIALYRKDRNVDRYELLGGDFFDKENAFCEPMTLWRRNKEKKTELAFVPKRHNASTQMWRNLSSLLARGDDNQYVAGVVSWIDRLHRSERIDKTKIQFQTMGILYGDKDFFVDDLVNDHLTLSPLLLSERYAEWSGRIVEEVGVTELLVRVLGDFAKSIAKASGETEDKRINGYGERTRIDAYYALDLPFRVWLEQIDPQYDEVDDVCDCWWQQSQNIVRRFGKELVKQCGRNAFMERKIEKTSHSIPLSYNRFMNKTSSIEALKGGNKK